MSSRTVRFYFDYISTNAYLAWEALLPMARKHDYVVEPVPVLFAGLLNAHGQLGPAEMPAKALWMIKNNLRKAALLGLPLNPPAFHPFNPLLALRASSVPLSPADRDRLVGALLRAVWVRGLHVSEPAVIERIAEEIGIDGADLLAKAQSAETKGRLRKQTDDAISEGVFGVPSMQVGSEIFWGYDDLPYLEPVLAGSDLLTADEWSKWLGPPQASAVRRRPGSASI